MSLLTQDYDYALPDALIARWPIQDRSSSRMMALHPGEQRIEHRSFLEFSGFVRDGDLVVLNDTRVIPARAFSHDGKVELLFLEKLSGNSWKCLTKPGRKTTVGKIVTIGRNVGEVMEVLPEGERVISFQAPVDLEQIGALPLPHYMDRQSDENDAERYQTVFARNPGAVAAPTAGLHFTEEILRTLPFTFITLHVGVGTFKPVKQEVITDHRMHSERFIISPEAADKINHAKRIIAVGTTTVRVLESCMARNGKILPQEGATDIFIHPPYEFCIVDMLLTNFHLPKSTLLMLVSAFAGREFVLKAYAEAISANYRFYSYGDCMLITK